MKIDMNYIMNILDSNVT